MFKKYLYIFLLILPFISYSQQRSKVETNNLQKLSYEVLIDSFYNTSKLHSKKFFVDSFINKAREEGDENKIKTAYYFYYDMYDEKHQDKALLYLDSLIKISINSPDKDFPALAYLGKGNILHKKRNFKGAINAYLKANDFASKYDNNLLIFSSNYHIAKLKDRIGNHKDAIDIHLSNTNFAEKNISIVKEYYYLNSIFALAFTYKNMRNIDSASYYNNLGLKLSDSFKIKSIKHYFTMNEGVISYFKEDYNNAELSIGKAKAYFQEKNDLPNLSEAYFYLGKIAYDQDYKERAIQYFKKVDTIFTKLNDLFPELRENYILLSKYYKKNQDIRQQLYYTEKLNEIDSILNSNHIYISDYFKKEYDIPKMVSEKEVLIHSLEQTNKSKNIYIYLSLVTILLVIAYFYRRQQIFRKRFEKLLKDDASINTEQTKIQGEKAKLDIPNDLVENILEGLVSFETQKGYLDADIKLSTLAKHLDTNTNYLSKTINYYKNKNINVYLNDLRVEYAIKKIQEDSKFRNYTIKAISKEVGFKSSETFSKTFYKNTGIYPSYFIRKIENKNKI